jgi:voltage-gated potassium channel
VAAALLLGVVAGGTLGYVLIEGWSWWDAFYMTVITVTTVGYREVHDLTGPGQLFTVVLLASGVGAALYAFTLLATAVVAGGLPDRLRRRRQSHMLDTIKDHFIVCGYGRIGGIVAAELTRQSTPVVVVERDGQRAHSAMEKGMLVVEDDASQEDALRQAGIERARGLIAAVGTDAENVFTVLSARVMRPDLYIVGRAESEDSIRKLQRAGANRVISPYQIGAVQMVQTALRPAVVDFVHLATSADNLELAMEEITVASGSPLADRSIVDVNVRQRFGAIVVAIQREDLRMAFNPEPEAVIRAGDKLIVLGRPDSLKRLEGEAGS